LITVFSFAYDYQHSNIDINEKGKSANDPPEGGLPWRCWSYDRPELKYDRDGELREVQKIESEDDASISGRWDPNLQWHPEVEVLVMERMEETGRDLGREARGVWKPRRSEEKTLRDSIESQSI
jgi:hypothetical protein